MLQRIERVQGVGLLNNANGAPHGCKKLSLIYADNGRGKSTLARVFRSVSTGDNALVSSCRTIDSVLPPKVILQFDSGHKVTYENGVWSERRRELVVFDSDFIERNVHSGGAVSTNQRKNLLDFALGETAVVARNAVDASTAQAKTASDNLQSIIAQLSGYHAGMTLDQFAGLPAVDDADTKIQDCQKRIVDAGNVNSILNRPIPSAINVPSSNIDHIFNTLSLSLQDVHDQAEQIVKSHIEKLSAGIAENWLSQGLKINNGTNCPYCDQDISGNELVAAYQSHFNIAYSELKAKVLGLTDVVNAFVNRGLIERFAQSVHLSQTQLDSWAETVESNHISFDSEACLAVFDKLSALLLNLVNQKLLSPTDPVGTEAEKLEAESLWQQAIMPMQIVNADIAKAVTAIGVYKGSLAAENVPQIQQMINNIESSKRRHDPAVTILVDQMQAAKASLATADAAKKVARENLDAVMTATLDQYQVAINTLLTKFGASFSITGMSGNFRGAAPRSEYGLLLRGQVVSLDGGPPSFATALSEGDKRTLAFAFFVASTLADPDLANKIVVIDDPMCSLDINRKHHTRSVLKKIHDGSSQLIILAHDLYFLRDFRDYLLKADKTIQLSEFQIGHTEGDYSDFSVIDLDKECESSYFRHHRMLNDFLGGATSDIRSVAKAIRPMLEGYLHRRFPGLIPKDLLFGQVVALIRNAQNTSPLYYAKGLVVELNDINEYAGQFHHDTNQSGADTVSVIATELRAFVEQSLALVHRGV